MSKVVFSLALVFCVAFGTVCAQDAFEAKPDQPSDDVARAKARLRVAKPPMKEPVRGSSRRQPGVRGIQRPAPQEGPPHERLLCRLDNAPAMDVANTLNTLLRALRDVGQLRGEVVIVPDMITNSLLISATPKDLEEVSRLIGELDRRPPSVRVELLIAEVQQRGRPGTARPARSSAADPRGALWEGWERPPGRPKAAAVLLGESGGPERSKSDQGLRQRLRALQGSGQLKILSRPQITTLNNQPAMILVGQKIPVLRPARSKESTKAATLAYEKVGLTVGLTPRISPRGRVTMEIDVEKSELGSPAQSVMAGVLESGRALRLPRIETTTLQTTVNVADGESTVIGGLTVESGPRHSKLLIVLTPHIIRE